MSSSNSSFSNPILKDRIEILMDTENKLIFRTFLEPNGGQSELHYHTRITEKLKVIKGELCVILEKDKKVFQKDESQLIEPYILHRFYNRSLEEVIFDVEIINPVKMKCGLQIMYGIAKDGGVNTAGLPINLFHLAIGLNMMNAYSPNFPHKLQYIGIKFLAGLGKVMGIEKNLMVKYCKF